jgi:hypothetical protein
MATKVTKSLFDNIKGFVSDTAQGVGNQFNALTQQFQQHQQAQAQQQKVQQEQQKNQQEALSKTYQTKLLEGAEKIQNGIINANDRAGVALDKFFIKDPYKTVPLANLGEIIGGGINTLAGKKAVNTDDINIFSHTGQKSVDAGKQFGKGIGNDQLGEDIGYGLAGAYENFLNPAAYVQGGPVDAKTDRQKNAKDWGNTAFGTIASAPLKGWGTTFNPAQMVTGVLSRGGQGAAIGVAGKVIGNLAQGKDITEDLGGGVKQGLKSSWILALTNAATEHTLQSILPSLTDAGKTAAFAKLANRTANGADLGSRVAVLMKEAAPRVFGRALAEVPLENTAYALVDSLNGTEKEGFFKAWMNNLPSTFWGNMAFAFAETGARGLWNGISKEDLKQASESLEKTVKQFAGYANNQEGRLDINAPIIPKEVGAGGADLSRIQESMRRTLLPEDVGKTSTDPAFVNRVLTGGNNSNGVELDSLIKKISDGTITPAETQQLRAFPEVKNAIDTYLGNLQESTRPVVAEQLDKAFERGDARNIVSQLSQFLPEDVKKMVDLGKITADATSGVLETTDMNPALKEFYQKNGILPPDTTVGDMINNEKGGINPFAKIGGNPEFDAKITQLKSLADSAESYPEFKDAVKQSAFSDSVTADQLLENKTTLKDIYEEAKGEPIPASQLSGREKIGTNPEDVDGRSMWQKFTDTKDDLYTRYVNDFQPLDALAKKAGQVDEFNRIKAQNHYGTGGRIKYAIDFELTPIFQKSGDPDKLVDYLVAMRDIEKGGQGFEGSDANIGAAKIKELQDSLTPDQFQNIEKSASDYWAFNKRLVKENLLDKGLISVEQFDAMNQNNGFYVPFQRIMDTVQQDLGVIPSKAPASVSGQDVIKKFGGSERQIQDPLEEIYRNVARMIGVGDRQTVADTVVDIGLKTGDIKPVVTADMVNQKIDLYSDAKELKPVQGKLERLVNTRNGWAKDLQKELNALNQEGLDVSLKDTSTPESPVDFPTSQELSARQTRKLIDNLVQQDPAGLESIRQKIGNRDEKLGGVLDQIESIQGFLNTVKEKRMSDINAARAIATNPGSNNQFIFRMKDGVKEVYESPQPVADAAKALNRDQIDDVVRVLQVPGRVFRLTATGANPEFLLPNTARDLQSAFVNVGLNPLRFVEGLAHMLKQDQTYQDFLDAGGLTSRVSIDTPYVQESLQSSLANTGEKDNIGDALKEMPGQAVNKVKNAIHLNPIRTVKDLFGLMQELGQYSEEPTRIAAFEQGYKKALAEGLSRDDAIGNGAIAAQESTVNFARHGSKIQSWNAMYAFLNARIQGTDRFIRSIQEDPKGAGSRALFSTIAPAIGAHMWNRQFQSYTDERVLTKGDRQQNYILMLSDKPIEWLGGAQFIKIPKNDVAKFLANPTEAFLYSSDRKDEAFGQALMEGFKGFAPIDTWTGLIPTAFQAPVETAVNKDWQGYEISPAKKKNLKPSDQWSDYTSPIYRYIADKIDTFTGGTPGQAGSVSLNPAQMEHIISGYFTGYEKIASMLLNKAVPDEYKSDKQKQGQTINTTPIIRRFLGGEKRTEAEQAPIDVSKTKGIDAQISQIKSMMKHGEITPDAGSAYIEKLTQQKIDVLDKSLGSVTRDAGATELPSNINNISGLPPTATPTPEKPLTTAQQVEDFFGVRSADAKNEQNVINKPTDINTLYAEQTKQQDALAIMKLPISQEKKNELVTKMQVDGKEVYWSYLRGLNSQNQATYIDGLLDQEKPETYDTKATEFIHNHVLTTSTINSMLEEEVISKEKADHLKDLIDQYKIDYGIKDKLTGIKQSDYIDKVLDGTPKEQYFSKAQELIESDELTNAVVNNMLKTRVVDIPTANKLKEMIKEYKIELGILKAPKGKKAASGSGSSATGGKVGVADIGNISPKSVSYQSLINQSFTNAKIRTSGGGKLNTGPLKTKLAKLPSIAQNIKITPPTTKPIGRVSLKQGTGRVSLKSYLGR